MCFILLNNGLCLTLGINVWLVLSQYDTPSQIYQSEVQRKSPSKVCMVFISAVHMKSVSNLRWMLKKELEREDKTQAIFLPHHTGQLLLLDCQHQKGKLTDANFENVPGPRTNHNHVIVEVCTCSWRLVQEPCNSL